MHLSGSVHGIEDELGLKGGPRAERRVRAEARGDCLVEGGRREAERAALVLSLIHI